MIVCTHVTDRQAHLSPVNCTTDSPGCGMTDKRDQIAREELESALIDRTHCAWHTACAPTATHGSQHVDAKVPMWRSTTDASVMTDCRQAAAQRDTTSFAPHAALSPAVFDDTSNDFLIQWRSQKDTLTAHNELVTNREQRRELSRMNGIWEWTCSVSNVRIFWNFALSSVHFSAHSKMHYVY